MEKNPVDKLISKRVGWLADGGADSGIAMSTRIRLARNIAGFPFPIQADADAAKAVAERAKGAVESSGVLKRHIAIDMENISKLDGGALMERHLVSRELLERPMGAALLLDEDETLSAMVNEEDHLRLQTICPGLRLFEAWEKINKFDDAVCQVLDIAFDPTLGFLTSCPTNLGTGMRASAMLHLPALALSGQVEKLVQGVNKLGLAVRGIFGEGSENLGNLCQISNQSTLGESEEDILRRLDAVMRQVVNHEKNARAKLLETRENFLLDSIGRAYGILKYAYSITSKEALNSLSLLRLGVDMEIIGSVDVRTVNELFVLSQPAHLMKHAGENLASEERDALRAAIIRGKLRPVS